MHKQSPFPDFPTFLRALIKALILMLITNAALIALRIDPISALVKVNTWDVTGRSRARLAYPSDFANGQLPLDALLATHAVSQPKAANEYRVILLGESGIAGWGVDDPDTLAAQLTDLSIDLDGKRVIAYNLAYPQPSAARDLLILDAALSYDPDLVIWFMTPAALNDAPDIAGANRVFFNLNRERLLTIIDTYPDLLSDWHAAHAADLIDEPPAIQRFIAIHNQDLLPVWLNSLVYPFEQPDLAYTDRRMGSEDVPAEARYTLEDDGFEPMPNPTWQFLLAGCQHAAASNTDLLLINEPMLIGSGGSADVNYNANYSRDLYDRYRDALPAYAADHGIRYADLWDIVPPARFTDTPLHMDAQGHGILSAAVRDLLINGNEKSTCK